MAVAVRHRPAAWNNSEAWEFEVPERSFRLPSASRIDRESPAATQLVALAPKVVFRWKRDGRLSKDMTCYMCGRSVGGKKSKEPDITVAMFRAAKNEGLLTVYEPNMARVDIEDLKGLELSLILGAVVIRDLYLAPRHDAFNMAGGPGPAHVNGQHKGPALHPPPPPQSTSQPVYASGALPAPPLTTTAALAPRPPPGRDPRQHAEIEAETKRLQAMVAQEQRMAREREKREAEEQKRIKRMLDNEDKERRRRDAEVERETERLRREYGISAPALPPRTGQSQQLPARYSGVW